MPAWLQFLLCAAGIVAGGMGIARHGDAIAEHSGLGRSWIGMLLVASVTSLPELVTGISSSAVAGLPDIAAGDVLGSCAFNLLVLGIADLPRRERGLFSSARRSQIVAVVAAIPLLLAVAAAIELGSPELRVGASVLDPAPIVLVGGYALALRAAFLLDTRASATEADSPPRVEVVRPPESAARLRHALVRYFAWSAVILVAGIVLPFAADRLAASAGLAHSVVGTTFVAATTSLPEIVVTVAAIRVGAAELAVGNLVGSNLFNLGILGVDAAVYRRATPLLEDTSRAQAAVAVCAALMTAVVLVALLRSTVPGRRPVRVGLPLIGLFVIQAWVVWTAQP